MHSHLTSRFPNAYEMHCDVISITHITHANISPCIYSHNLNHTIILCNFSFHHIKISSRGLMIKHEQFDLNYSTNTLFHKNYFENTVSGIVKPSVTIIEKSQFLGSPCEPAFHGHFRPHSNQYMIYHVKAQFHTQTSRGQSRLHHWDFKNSYQFGPKV